MPRVYISMVVNYNLFRGCSVSTSSTRILGQLYTLACCSFWTQTSGLGPQVLTVTSPSELRASELRCHHTTIPRAMAFYTTRKDQ
jgi:hypothetical protein